MSDEINGIAPEMGESASHKNLNKAVDAAGELVMSAKDLVRAYKVRGYSKKRTMIMIELSTRIQGDRVGAPPSDLFLSLYEDIIENDWESL